MELVQLTGTLHVSFPTDIIQFFGTGSVPAIVAGSVLGVFEVGERFASQRAKDALSKWLLTFDVQKAKALPDGTQEFFAKIFGEISSVFAGCNGFYSDIRLLD
jgi:hypothetical protein